MGTLGEKLTYLDNTKSILKQKINNLGGSLTDQSTFRSYGNYLDELYNEMPKVTGEGTEITLSPTRKGRMQLDLKGNTSQATRILPEGYTQLDYIESTGTQYIDTGRFSTPNTKFEMDYISTKQLGDAFQCLFGSQNSNSNKRVYMLLGSAKNNVQLQFSHDTDFPLFMQNNGTFASTQQNTDVIVNTGEKNKIIFDNINRSVTIGQYTSVSTSTYEILPSNHNILILSRNDNTTPTSNFATGKLYRFKWYENNVLTMDFVPCKDSNNVVGLYDLVSQAFFGNAGTGDFVAGNETTIPSPDYPQDIHVVTGNNTIEVQGKNFFDVNQDMSRMQYNQGVEEINANRVTTDYIPIKAGSTYTIFCDLANQNNVALINYALFDANKIYLGNRTTNGDTSFTGNKTHTFTITLTNAEYIRITFRNYADATSPLLVEDVKNSDIQLEQGSTATDYTPYYHQDYPINLGNIELCKIGDYQDYLYKENDNWYKYGAIEKIILDGHRTYVKSTIYSNEDYPVFFLRTSIPNFESNCNIYCNKFIQGDYIILTDKECMKNMSQFHVRISASRLNGDTVDDYRTWLASNNLTVYYGLATPTTTQITDTTLIEQLENISNAMSTTDTTNITQTNADLPFIITASALKPFTTEILLTSLTSEE